VHPFPLVRQMSTAESPAHKRRTTPGRCFAGAPGPDSTVFI
jgi:hypothetical protein